jgi:hypothetical protein
MKKILHTGLISICFLLLHLALVPSASGQTAPSGQAALDQYSKGNYAVALVQFSALSSLYPRDPLYKYYHGVCLVRLEKDPQNAIILLRDSKQNGSGIKKVPDDISFYLGRALQMSGDFSNAIISFKEFSDAVGKKSAKDYQVSKYIQECNDKKGEVTVTTRENKMPSQDSIRPARSEVVKSQQVLPLVKKDTSSVSQKKPPADYVKKLNEALNYQYLADSLTRLNLGYREQIGTLPEDQKAGLKVKISETDRLILDYQRNADDLLNQAKKISGQEQGEPVSAVRPSKNDSLTTPRSIVPVVVPTLKKTAKDTVTGKKPTTFTDAMSKNKSEKNNNDSLIKPDTLKKPVLQKSPGIYSVFSINKQAAGQDSKVQINPDTEAGLIYRIQVAVFRNQVMMSYFRGITPVYGFRNTGSDITNYYAGMFRRYVDASAALIRVKSAGFKDGFIVALMDKKIISMERAAVLEKEWSSRPFASASVTAPGEIAKDTVPPTLVFRVEATRNKKPLPEDQVENLKRLAANRGFDMIKNASGVSIYLIGKFLTFESAAEYADLLSRNGYKDAKVTAYLGLREIPVETARQLFEKY